MYPSISKHIQAYPSISNHVSTLSCLNASGLLIAIMLLFYPWQAQPRPNQSTISPSAVDFLPPSPSSWPSLPPSSPPSPIVNHSSTSHRTEYNLHTPHTEHLTPHSSLLTPHPSLHKSQNLRARRFPFLVFQLLLFTTHLDSFSSQQSLLVHFNSHSM